MTLTFGERLQGSFEQLYGYVPALFGALVILFAGYLLARLLEKGTDRLMRRIRFNQILEKGGVMQAVERSGSHVNPTRVAASLVFWFVMFAVMLVAANALGLQSLANVFSELVSYIPSVIASRSEEHTSELQSLAYLVCRLLLEKKKKNTEEDCERRVAGSGRRSPCGGAVLC